MTQLLQRSFKFSKRNRLDSSEQFKQTLQNGKRFYVGPLRLVCQVKNQQLHPKIGLSIAKRFLKAAHDRNKIKRIVRESFRNASPLPSGISIVVLGTEQLKKKFCFVQLRAQLDQQWKKMY